MKFYRVLMLLLAIAFGLFGALVLFVPYRILALFNALSPVAGLPPGPVEPTGFFVILAAAYMYTVMYVAAMIYLHPRHQLLPLVLVHGKAMSSILSLGFFLFSAPLLIYAANFVVDGVIALFVWVLRNKYAGGRRR